MHMKFGAQAPFERLIKALEHIEPACQDDDRYIIDRGKLPDAARSDMANLCSTCPLLDACIAYAAAADPPAGWWPGLNLKIAKKEAA